MDITVVIPTYNRYELLKRALHSVYAQTFLPSEVIVIDDGSCDGTVNIQNDFPQIKYIYQENRGVSSARNTGIKNTQNAWIAFLDSDDEWLEDKLALQKEFHQKNSEILMSYTDEFWIRDNKEMKIPKKFFKIGKDAFFENIEYCNIAPSSAFVHSSLFEKVGMFDESLEVCEDYDLWLRIALENKIGLVDKKLIKKYAGHEEQLSFKHWGMDRYRVKALKKHLDSDRKELIRKVLKSKYILLLQGAKKHNRGNDIKLYEQQLVILEEL